jgi:hypothetical protein
MKATTSLASLGLLSLLPVGCGGATRLERGPHPEPRALESEPEVAARESITIEPTVLEAPAPACALPPTDCSVADACPRRAVDLRASEAWCATQPPPREVATLQGINGMTLAEGSMFLRSGSGDFAWSGGGWTRVEGAPRWIVGGDAWRLSTRVTTIECEPGRVSCRSGRRKCAAPRDVCHAIPELELATHGAASTPITVRNPLLAGRSVHDGLPRTELMVGIAGTASDDVWILSSHFLFHWDGVSVSTEPLETDPLVELLSDATGVYGRTRAGTRLRVEDGVWHALPEQPGPFLGAAVEAPPHPFVTLEWARATGPDAFWGYGRLRAFEGQDLASAVVHYEAGHYQTFVGAMPTSSWWRIAPVDVPAADLRSETWSVLVEDAAYAPGVFPFVTIGWQAVRALELLPASATGDAVVGSGTGLYQLDGSAWTRLVAGNFDALGVTATALAAGTDQWLYLREEEGMCPAMRLPRTSPGLAVVGDRVWTAAGATLAVTSTDHRTERIELSLEGRPVVLEQLVADGDRLVALARDEGDQIAITFDGETWSATDLGPIPYARLLRSPDGALSTPNLRFEGGCWSRTEDVAVPLLEVPADHHAELRMIGATEVRVELGWAPD